MHLSFCFPVRRGVPTGSGPLNVRAGNLTSLLSRGTGMLAQAALSACGDLSRSAAGDCNRYLAMLPAHMNRVTKQRWYLVWHTVGLPWCWDGAWTGALAEWISLAWLYLKRVESPSGDTGWNAEMATKLPGTDWSLETKTWFMCPLQVQDSSPVSNARYSSLY